MNQKQKLSTNRNELRKFIVHWNNNFPIDFLWRKKYGVAFGSPEHRQMSFLDMLFDFEEEKMMKEMVNKHSKLNVFESNPKFGLSDEEFDDIDINQFNIKEDE